MGHGESRCIESAIEVHADQMRPLLFGDVHDAAGKGHPGARNHRVQPPRDRHKFGYGSLDLPSVANVGGQWNPFSAHLAKDDRKLLCLLAPPSEQTDYRTTLRERAGGSPADSRSCTRD